MHDHLPSETATIVARSVMLASRDSVLAKLVHMDETPLLEKILGGAPGHWQRRLSLRYPWLRRLSFATDHFVVPGITAHYLVRKRRIELAVRQALDEGAEQVVVIAAGFDLLAWRLAREYPHARFRELDHPATQKVKRAALPETANFHYSAVDLAKVPLAEALNQCAGFIPGSSTVFIAEGLTMYLTENQVAVLLRDCALAMGPRGMTAFTFMRRVGCGPIAFHRQHPVLDLWLRQRGEPFLWGISSEALPAFLQSCGLGASQVLDDSDLRREILAPLGLTGLPLARGECLCLSHPLSS